MWWSGLRISTLWSGELKSPAVTAPSPDFLITICLGSAECERSSTSFRLRTMSVTSSTTPGIEVNSCSTPSIRTVVIAAPCSDDSRTRRSALPSVVPKPRSSGSHANLP